jgi:hypothetical protein
MALNGKSLPEKEFVSLRHNKGGKARIMHNSERQGKKSKHEFVTCKQCGYRVDKNVTDHTGGTQDDNGGYGPITKYSDGHGEQVVKKGSGCPLCGSKNFL